MDIKTLVLLLGLPIFVLLFLVVAIIFFTALRPWIRGLTGGAYVPLLNILGMRLRGCPPGLIIDTLVTLHHRGLGATIEEVESTYLAHRDERLETAQLADFVEERLKKKEKQGWSGERY